MQLDRSVFRKQSFDSAADHQSAYREMSWEERGRTFQYLMRINFGFGENGWPRMDKPVFEVRVRR